MKRARYFLLTVLLFIGLGCERQTSLTATAEEELLEEAPAQETWDVRFQVFHDERPRAEIVAPYMARYEREDSTYTLFRDDPQRPNGRVSAYLFDENADSSAVLTANRLTYFDDEDRFDARGEVEVETADGKRVEGEHLAWMESERKVRTPGFVRIITPTDRVQGYGLVADENLATYELADVTGETTIEDL